MSDAGVFFAGAALGALTVTVAGYFILSSRSPTSAPSSRPAMRGTDPERRGKQWYVLLYKEAGPRARLGGLKGPYDSKVDADRFAATQNEIWYPKVRALTPAQLDRL